jgi:hypothetical protein
MVLQADPPGIIAASLMLYKLHPAFLRTGLRKKIIILEQTDIYKC